MSIDRKPPKDVFAGVHLHLVPTSSPGSGAPETSEAQLCAQAALDAQEQRRRSKDQPSNVPLKQTLTWAASLPADIRPHELIRVFGRIANYLAVAWDDPEATRAYFDSLLVSQRPYRKGFPPQILAEIVALHAYYMNQTFASPSAGHGVDKG